MTYIPISPRERDAMLAAIGVKTLDELFEAWSWSQVGLQEKPNGLLNLGGYYDPLLAFLDRATAAGFMQPRHRQMLAASGDVAELLDGFAAAAAGAAR